MTLDAPSARIDSEGLPAELDDDPALGWAAAELRAALETSRSAIPGGVVLELDAEAGEESFRIQAGAPIRLRAGDVRGFVYALGELAEQVLADPGEAFAGVSVERSPATLVRGIMRLLTSEVVDDVWFRDRDFWGDYLDELARARINRFTLSMGAGYDYFIDKDYRDLYFQFAYPFLVSPEGWDVRAEGLTDERRRENLELVRFIGRETRRRGISFRLGLWNHAWDCAPIDGDAPHKTVGLDGEGHAAYCRDALWTLLTEVPEIEGVTFRVHFEGGVPEPTHEFWRVVLSRIASVPTLREIDAHAKGVDDRLRDVFAETGVRFSISTKFWAEHTGLPYHAASIRERERDPQRMRASALRAGGGAHADKEGSASATTVTTARSFTRYGYGDFLRADRSDDVLVRIWPGSQRLLLWGDPETAAQMGRIGGFCGIRGWDWFEPLSFLGKKGTGRPRARDLYQRADLALGLDDWRKYRYTIRLFGRLGYEPDAPAEVWRGVLREEYGDDAARVEEALRHASRILPLVTAVHAPSAAQNMYWPEIYSDVPLVPDPDPKPNPWVRSGWAADGSFDVEGRYVFQEASPLDPEVIYGIAEYARDEQAGVLDGRRTPAECADELDHLADAAVAAVGPRPDRDRDISAQTARALIDAVISAGIGRFFARKIRAATAFARYELTGDTGHAAAAAVHLADALAVWDDFCEIATVYHPDQAFGMADYARGHWRDRRAAIAADLVRVRAIAGDAAPAPGAAQAPAPPSAEIVEHDPERDVRIGADGVEIRARLSRGVDAVELRFRQVDQSQRWSSVPMAETEGQWAGVIPPEVLDSPFAVQYAFRWAAADGTAREPRSWGARLRAPYDVVAR
jgi:hypothetical protein